MLFAPSGPQSPRRRNRIKSIFLTIFIVLAIYFLFFSHTESSHKPTTKTDYAQLHKSTPSPKADEQARPAVRRQKEMVVASVKSDDTSWFAEYFPDWSRSIYVVDDKKAPLTVPQNKGRESMVFLTYIIDHYDSLPDVMLFLHSQRFQWHNDDPYYDGVAMLRRFQVPYLQKKGYVNLRCVWTLGCPVEIRPLSDGHRDDVHAGEYFMKAFKKLFPLSPVPEEIGASCCSQFGLTRDQVRLRPKSDYEHYRRWLLETELTDDLSGRIMEYSWHIIFGQDPIFCPSPAGCYCSVFGICEGLICDGGTCEGRYVLPPFSSLPKGWPYVGWKGQAQNPSYGLPES